MITPIEVRNPRTGKFDYVIVPPPAKLLSQQCHRLRRGQISWQEIGVEARIETIKQFREAIVCEYSLLKNALVSDTGRLGTSTLEIDIFLNNIDKWCNLAPQLLQSTAKNTSLSFISLRQQLAPYRLVGIISPSHFPLLTSTVDAIPALLAGCSVIIKPSELTPRFFGNLMTIINKINKLKDVLTCIEGGPETGAILIDEVDLICFRGSLQTGRLVAQNAARNFIPAFLELEGKNPAIILESANLDLAASAILWSAVMNRGGSSIERIYVAESIYEEFYHLLITKSHQLKLAYPDIKSGEIGPIMSENQAKIINNHLQDAIKKGAVIHCGGKVEEMEGTWWCKPTVLTQVDHSMKIMMEQTFGPIMPIMSFSTVAEAVNLANDSIYGLNAAIFAESEELAVEIGMELDVGAISINDAGLTAIMQEGENHPLKFSGLGGSRMGNSVFKKFLQTKAFLIKTNNLNNPWWFNTEQSI